MEEKRSVGADVKRACSSLVPSNTEKRAISSSCDPCGAAVRNFLSIKNKILIFKSIATF